MENFEEIVTGECASRVYNALRGIQWLCGLSAPTLPIWCCNAVEAYGLSHDENELMQTEGEHYDYLARITKRQ